MELGSNFDLDISKVAYCKENVNQYLENLHPMYTDSGRSAIKLIVSRVKKGKVLLPVYICRSVVDCFMEDFEIGYYQIDKQLKIDVGNLEQQLDETVTVVYIMHYFGKLQSEEIWNFLSRKKGELQFTIIEDATHSFLSRRRTIGDYQICSLRKWFAVPDGGVLYSKNTYDINDKLEANPGAGNVCGAMLLKYLFLHNKVECNEVYRNIFVSHEAQLDRQEEIYGISDVSDVLLKCENIERVSRIRKENWDFLRVSIKNNLVQPIYRESSEDFVPFAYPVFVKDRDKFRAYLMEHQIYCAVHWPLELDEQKNVESARFISEHILSLPIDQRYTLEEMGYMADIINKYK